MTIVFGPYDIHGPLGNGGMATVCEAQHRNSGKRVALKILHPHIAKQQNYVARFHREAQAISLLDHPRVIKIFDVGRVKGRPYIAMQYMPGGDLSKVFDHGTQVSLKIVIRLLRQIADGLDHAHAVGIVHRDLKMQNILLDEGTNIVISDFGIAHVPGLTRMTFTGDITGTPLCMSPEQGAGYARLDHRSDVYAFAVMAYLMSTGYYPFTGNTALAILKKHMTMPPPTPSLINKTLPAAIDPVLCKGLAKDPDKRYQSVSALVDDFEHAVMGNI